jgi:hypothetical protein
VGWTCSSDEGGERNGYRIFIWESVGKVATWRFVSGFGVCCFDRQLFSPLNHLFAVFFCIRLAELLCR